MGKFDLAIQLNKDAATLASIDRLAGAFQAARKMDQAVPPLYDELLSTEFGSRLFLQACILAVPYLGSIDS